MIRLQTKGKLNIGIFLIVLIVAAPFLMAACSAVYPGLSESVNTTPDYGIYWFGRGNVSQKAIAGEQNPYFDPTRPSILFIHGWLPDQVTEPPTFDVELGIAGDDKHLEANVADAWIEDGWNAGIFYWHPFADEDIVLDAEAKIWTTAGPKGMRWRSDDGAYHTENAPTSSVSELLLQSYLDAMGAYSGSEIRIAGHSLGNQLAVNLTSHLASSVAADELSEALLPQRLVLLDPYWSPLPRDYLQDQRTGERIVAAITGALLPTSMLVEWYRSSSMTDGTLVSDANLALQPHVVFIEMRPLFCPFHEQVCKHDASWRTYFLSFASPPPGECEHEASMEICRETGRFAALAGTSAERLAEMMFEPYTWIQTVAPDGSDGRETPDPADDWYMRVPKVENTEH